MSQRQITARDMLRYQTCERLLRCNQLTPETRYEQARTAQRTRNFFFTATLEPQAAFFTLPLTGQRLLARTPTFSDPLILTDLITLWDWNERTTLNVMQVECFEYGGQERSSGVDFFGLSSVIPQRLILKHEKNYSDDVTTNNTDLQSKHVRFVPRLLAPYQQLEFSYRAVGGGTPADTTDLWLQVGARAVRCLLPDNPYSYFTESTDREIKNYIDGSQPETFFLEAQLPIANFPAVGATVQIKTPQQGRPLLVLGATCNVEGVQAELTDESKYYTFTKADVPLFDIPAVPNYKAPPLSLWASNSDFRNMNTYHMWSVPHLLEPGAQFLIKLTNGLNPDNAGSFGDRILTRSEQPARITFLCRTM